MRWPRSLTRADSSPAPRRVNRASVSRVSCALRRKKKALVIPSVLPASGGIGRESQDPVILSAGGVRFANAGVVEGPRRRRCSQGRIKEFFQRNLAHSPSGMPFGFLVAQSSVGSFDSADSPLREEYAALRMTGRSDVKCGIPISLPLPLVRLAFEPGPEPAPGPRWGSMPQPCRR